MESLFELSAYHSCTVDFELNESPPAARGNLFKVFDRQIGFVRAHFTDFKSSLGFFDQRNELRAIPRVFIQDANRRYHVGFDSARDMRFDPHAFHFRDAVFLVIPALVPATAEAAGINRELPFNGTERQSTMAHQSFQDRRE